MVWSWLRRGRATPKLPLPGGCGQRRHTLRTERLLLYTPETMLDLAAVLAAASDAEAQRWLGWGEGLLTDARVRDALLRVRPGDAGSRPPFPGAGKLLAEPFPPRPDQGEMLVGVRLDDGRYAGATELNTATGEIGGWLAPHARGRGLGAELFRAAVLLGHDHLGLRSVRAGHEPANTASARALRSAGFVADDGPPRHTLGDGREIDARWLRHTSPAPPRRCRGAGPEAPDGPAGGTAAEEP
ncbi:GNAT family N-acetyltransferase [Streptomyces sp. NPDC096132]|uniref:GNAT family N-acetyltransferase n=1 Tax=Streptomyces sp. NPDC096132 TaxID=3366075 RepID=UPI003814AE11